MLPLPSDRTMTARAGPILVAGKARSREKLLMSGIILHHYGLSPYSEKIRAILGYKKLAWHSVTVPVIMPKPDVMALTGGYRRAPVMQLGRDIYCDTRLIARVLDRLQPEPPLVPAHLRASCQAFAALQRSLFFATIPAA